MPERFQPPGEACPHTQSSRFSTPSPRPPRNHFLSLRIPLFRTFSVSGIMRQEGGPPKPRGRPPVAQAPPGECSDNRAASWTGWHWRERLRSASGSFVLETQCVDPHQDGSPTQDDTRPDDTPAHTALRGQQG